MNHPFMEGVAAALAREGVASYRFDFPYMAAGRKLPDRPPILVPAVRQAVSAAQAAAPDLPLFAGGKSMGGRMTSTAAAEGPLCPRPDGGDRVRGLIFLGFPLHSPGKPGVVRADHLDAVELPVLFLQGDRDRLAHLELLRPVVARLGGRATLHVARGADHGFHVLKRSGRSDEDVLQELAATAATWMRRWIESRREA
jgi:predicted alpha/beta-hydrolase family hydrolase